MTTRSTLSVLTLTALLAACAPAAKPAFEPGKLPVAATIYPIAYLAERVGGEYASVDQLTPGGVEPHDFEPSAAQIAALHDAKVFFLNGGGVDEWAARSSAELEKAGVTVVAMTDKAEPSIVDAPGGGETLDPHLWLDPARMQMEADAILEAFIAADPAHADAYIANAESVQEDLLTLDDDFKAGLAACAVKKAIVSHDAFRYQAARYGFETLAIAGFSPEAEPSPARIAELSALAKKEGIGYVFFETLASPKLSQTLATEAGARTLTLNPIEGLTAEDMSAGKDYLSIMRENLANLRTAMRCS
jgi:zinc transport system substrate-binding protein